MYIYSLTLNKIDVKNDGFVKGLCITASENRSCNNDAAIALPANPEMAVSPVIGVILMQ